MNQKEREDLFQKVDEIWSRIEDIITRQWQEKSHRFKIVHVNQGNNKNQKKIKKGWKKKTKKLSSY